MNELTPDGKKLASILSKCVDIADERYNQYGTFTTKTEEYLRSSCIIKTERLRPILDRFIAMEVTDKDKDTIIDLIYYLAMVLERVKK